jgi:hypothetical protein
MAAASSHGTHNPEATEKGNAPGTDRFRQPNTVKAAEIPADASMGQR